MSDPEHETAPSDKPATGAVYAPPWLPNQPCLAACCRNGREWVDYQRMVDEYSNGPCPSLLKLPWLGLGSAMKGLVFAVRLAGLARWDDLPPVARDAMSEWSPIARQLWESDFDAHQDGLVQAWIWHYLDDNIFWSAGTTGTGEGLAPCASPAWEHVRALRRELQVVRAHHSAIPKHRVMAFLSARSHLVHLQAWGRLTEELVRDGLGLDDPALEPFSPEQLIPHFKKSLRLFVADGSTKIPDREDDTDWAPYEALYKHGDIHNSVKRVLGQALILRHLLHGMRAVWDFRFTPLPDSDKPYPPLPDGDKPWGFPFDEKWMEDWSPRFVPRHPPPDVDAPPPPVQLVIQPMLVKSGFDGARNIQGFDLQYPMRTLSAWTFDAKDAYPGYPGGLLEQLVRNRSDSSEADNGEVGGGGGGGRAQGETNGPKEEEGDDGEEEEAAKVNRGGKADKRTAVAAKVNRGGKADKRTAVAASKRKRSPKTRVARNIRAK